MVLLPTLGDCHGAVSCIVALTQSGPGEPWNMGKLVGEKAPLRLKEIWAIRIRLQLAVDDALEMAEQTEV
jgi:hypothetical protein